MTKLNVHGECYRPDIDGLRAIAILLVIGFHSFPTIIPGGFIGVDVFFVISGYLIGGILVREIESGTFRFANFYFRRIRRIFPALILVLLVALILGWNLLLADEFKLLGKDVATSAAFVANFALWQQAGYFDGLSEVKPLLHLWSLAIEEQFYTLWPLLLLALGRSKVDFRTGLVFVFAASLMVSIWLTYSNPTAAFYSPLSRCWELASGTLLYVLARTPSIQDRLVNSKTTSLARLSIGRVIGVMLIVVGAFFIHATDRFPGLLAIIPVCGSLLVIASGSTAPVSRYLLENQPLVRIGVISYSLYLWHWLLLTYAKIVKADLTIYERLEVIALTFAAALLTYECIERPIRSGGIGKPKISAIVILLLAVLAIGLKIYSLDGIASRYPPFIQKLTKPNFSIKSEAREGECFLAPDEDASKFSPACTEKIFPLIFLWGDSHAAAMYPGVKALQVEHAFGVAQYTSSACPPVLDVSIEARPLCKSINAFALEQVLKDKPDVVVLEAKWRTQLILPLEATIRTLHEAGVAHVVIIGNSPNWQEYLSHLVVEEWKNDPLHLDPPLRMQPRGWEQMVKIDAEMQKLASRSGAEFISLTRILCSDTGCLTRVPPKQEEIAAFNGDHLTPAAATYVMRQIFAQHRILPMVK